MKKSVRDSVIDLLTQEIISVAKDCGLGLTVSQASGVLLDDPSVLKDLGGEYAVCGNDSCFRDKVRYHLACYLTNRPWPSIGDNEKDKALFWTLANDGVKRKGWKTLKNWKGNSL